MEAKTTIRWLYYLATGLMLVSLPFSNYFMSVSQFGLVTVFIVDGVRKAEVDNFFRKYKPFMAAVLLIPALLAWLFKSLGRKLGEFFHRENAPALVFASIYLIHLLGLFFTTDFQFAVKDLRIKLPILIMPVVLSTTSLLDRKAFRYLMYFFVAAVFTGTLISTYHLAFGNITDSRDISRYISHIRFSLLIDMAIFILAYLSLRKSDIPRWPRAFLGLMALWLISFLVISAFMTGLAVFLITALVLAIYIIMEKLGTVMKILTISAIAGALVIAILYLRGIGQDVNRIVPVNPESLDRATSLGNPYWHDLSNPQVENGSYVWQNVATDELREAWNRRSRYDFDGKDKAGQEIRYTIIRFMTSKGLRKDAEGVSRLSDREVALIEDGIASIVYVEKPNLYVRIYKIFWEYTRYQQTQNASGHSVMQRLEFWRASMHIIRNNFLTGVGTGDLEQAFQDEYARSGSQLDKQFRWRSHNQFLSIFATFGIPGILWFIFCLLYPALRLGKFPDYYYLSFFIIIMLSMLTEDTLETQAGVTLFAFFSSFYLFAKKFIDII